MSTTTTYPVMEQFYTVQGEGAFTGTPAYFIRLGGCDVGCVWCDVKESWDADAHPKVAVKELISNIQDAGALICVVTGGEPLMHDLEPLTTALKDAGIRAHIETSGVHPITGNWDWITFSPKKFKSPLPEIYTQCDELKVIVYNNHDLEWAQEHTSNLQEDALLFLQPEWSKRDSAIPRILNFIREYPKWRISLQTHKYMGIP